MKNPSLLLVAVVILGIGFLTSLGGIIYLAAANPARAIPDILVGTTTLILRRFLPFLAADPTRDRG